MDTVASLALPEVLVLSEPEPQNERDRRSRSVPAEMRRAPSYNHRELPPVGLPPVHLPVSGRTIGRHVSLGPGWELNKEGQVAYPDDQPSTSSQALIPPLVSYLHHHRSHAATSSNSQAGTATQAHPYASTARGIPYYSSSPTNRVCLC